MTPLKTFIAPSRRLFICLIGGILFLGKPLKSQHLEYLVGYGEGDITPELAVKNWITGKEYPKVNDPLYTRVAIFSDGKNKGVVVSLDLVDAGESLTDEIRKAIGLRLNIPTSHIMVTATHTHSAPWAPVYNPGYRGKENDTWWAIRYMPAQNDYPPFKNWMQKLLDAVIKAAVTADSNLKPATLWIGKADISAYANNRRPVKPQWGVAANNAPKGYTFRHEAYQPEILLDGANYGPLDRTMSLLSFRDVAGKNILSLFHMSVHSVAIYPYSEEISADWPGEAIRQIKSTLGSPVMFLQGTAGDINPWRRGREAVNEMGRGVAQRAKGAFDWSVKLVTDSLIVKRAVTGLPLDAKGKERTGLDIVQAEVQVMTIGPLALVTLPGEPLTDLGSTIRSRSPYPHTLVLGYSNGNGVHYVGMPGEKSKGGYEMEAGTVGTDEAGLILVEAAVRLLNETFKDSKK